MMQRMEALRQEALSAQAYLHEEEHRRLTNVGTHVRTMVPWYHMVPLL